MSVPTGLTLHSGDWFAKSNDLLLVLILLPQLGQHGQILEGDCVAGAIDSRGDVTKQSAHDFTAPRLGQGGRESDLNRSGQSADLHGDTIAKRLSQRLAGLLAGLAGDKGGDKGSDKAPQRPRMRVVPDTFGLLEYGR